MAATTFSLALVCFSCADSAAVEMKKMSGVSSFNARWMELTRTPGGGGAFKIHLWWPVIAKLVASFASSATDAGEVLCSRALSVLLTILCRRLLRHPPPHLPPGRQRWLKSVLSWNCWGEPESAKEDRNDWHNVIKPQQPSEMTCCVISPAVLCLTLSVFVFGDLRTAFGPPDTRPRPRWMAFSLEENRCMLFKSVKVGRMDEDERRLRRWSCRHEERGNRSPSIGCQPSERCSENSDSHLPWWES